MANILTKIPSAGGVAVLSYDDVAFFGAMKYEGRTIVHIEMDPATAAALWEIAKGILAKIGAEILSKFLGGGATVDFEKLFRALLVEIADIVKASLDAAEIQQATSEMQGLTLLMKEYVTATVKSEARLDFCIAQSALVVKRLENLLPLSASAFSFGTFLRLVALQEKSKITGDAGEEENVRNYAAESLPKLNQAYDYLLTINAQRVSSISMESYDEFRGVGGGVHVLIGPGDGGGAARGHTVRVVKASYVVDGTLHSAGLVGDRSMAAVLEQQVMSQITPMHESDVSRVKENFMTQVGISLQSAKDNLEAISKMM